MYAKSTKPSAKREVQKERSAKRDDQIARPRRIQICERSELRAMRMCPLSGQIFFSISNEKLQLLILSHNILRSKHSEVSRIEQRLSLNVTLTRFAKPSLGDYYVLNENETYVPMNNPRIYSCISSAKFATHIPKPLK